jgi:hypothetical protein
MEIPGWASSELTLQVGRSGSHADEFFKNLVLKVHQGRHFFYFYLIFAIADE